MKQLAFWLPGRKEQGLGHFSRSQNLATELRAHGISSLYFSTDGDQYDISSNHSFLTTDFSSTEKIENFIKKNNVGYLIIDNYFIEENLLESVSQIIPSCYFVTDPTNIAFDSYINTNIYAEALLKDQFLNQKCFWGTNFRPKLTISSNPERKEYDLFICLGAGNPPERLFEILDQTPKTLQIALVLGPGTTKENLSRAQKYNIKIYHDPSDLISIAIRCKKAIISASTLVYEMIQIDLPLVLMVYVDNHKKLAKYLENHHDIHVIYDENEIDMQKALSSAKKLTDINFGSQIPTLAKHIKSHLEIKD